VSRDRRQRSKQKLRRRADEHAVGELVRTDVPGALDHASGEVDEFDAALVRGAGGTSVPAADVERAERATEPDTEPDEHALATETADERGGGRGGNGAVGNASEDAEGLPARREQARPPAAPRGSLPVRAVAFLRASWAELQRVQWPDRPEVFQATAVVLGFVVVMGVYLGVADWVAQKIVNFVL
jgi:preprotein translocase SecE subunit